MKTPFVLKSKIWMMVILSLSIFASAPTLRAELIDESEDDPAKPSKPSTPLMQQPDDLKPKILQPAVPPAPKPVIEPRPNARNKTKNSKAGVVKFWSKSLSGSREQDTLVLEEDVVVTQDDIRLEADKATIFFEQGGKDVKEVHAIGSVKFSRTDPETGQPIRAEGREAVFSNAKRNVVMKGEPILHRGDDIVRGKVIYYDLKNGWVKADRVEGVVQPSTKKAGSK